MHDALQDPLVHTLPAPQVEPHVPQFNGSFCVLAHPLPHRTLGNEQTALASVPVSTTLVSGDWLSVTLTSPVATSPVGASIAV